jgi:putative IMPACT (imprinted ancient) family translation regulator
MKGGVLARYSDDGEPQGTAGMPTLDAIRKSGACDVCVVVTRYFGGILLGAGGLARAYARGARDAVAEAGICRFSKFFKGKITVPYPLFSKVEFELNTRNYRLTGKEFGEGVDLFLLVSEKEKEGLETLLGDLSGGKMKLEIVGDTFAEDRDDA